MRRLWRYCRSVDNASEYTSKVLIWLIPILLVIFCWEVLLRSVFNHATIWAHESTQYFFGAYFALGGAYALRVGRFVSVDTLVERMKPRTRAIIDGVTGIVTLLFIVALIWKGFDLALHSVKIGEVSSTAWNPPVWPIKIVVVAGSLLLGMQTLADYIRTIKFAVTGKK